MRTTGIGLHVGARIRVVGAPRKRARGTISREPANGVVYYRCDYNLGEHLALLSRVKAVRTPRYKGG